MGQIALQVPVAGQPNASEDPKLASNMSVIQTWANGNVDSTNISAALAQAAAVNQSGQTVKGATNIATSQSTSSASYTTLATPDQVTGIVLPTNGLIRVWYQATWSVGASATVNAALFLGSNQLQIAAVTNGGTYTATTAVNPGLQTAQVTVSSSASFAGPLFTTASGLAPYFLTVSNPGVVTYSGDVTTGQIIGTNATSASQTAAIGGPCDVFAAAGTYTVSVQFKTSGPSLTVSNRKLWVQAISFA